MANLCREAALGPIRSIVNIQYIEADQVRRVNFKYSQKTVFRRVLLVTYFVSPGNF